MVARKSNASAHANYVSARRKITSLFRRAAAVGRLKSSHQLRQHWYPECLSGFLLNNIPGRDLGSIRSRRPAALCLQSTGRIGIASAFPVFCLLPNKLISFPLAQELIASLRIAVGRNGGLLAQIAMTCAASAWSGVWSDQKMLQVASRSCGAAI